MACWPTSVETDDARSYVTFRIDPQRAVLRRPAGASPRTCCSPGSCCATRAGPTTACTTPRSPRPRRSIARTVRFDFGGASDRELPLILGLMPVLPKHAVDPETFEETTLDAAARLRPLSRHRGRAGRQRDADAQSRLLGPRPADQSRPVEFRRDPARLLPRGQRPVRGVQARPLRLPRRERTAALARRLRLSRPRATAK